MPELWAGITCIQRCGRKKEWKKNFCCFFFITVNSDKVILLNTNILTCYL